MSHFDAGSPAGGFGCCRHFLENADNAQAKKSSRGRYIFKISRAGEVETCLKVRFIRFKGGLRLINIFKIDFLTFIQTCSFNLLFSKIGRRRRSKQHREAFLKVLWS
jgi:hypothetical protein